MIQVATGNHSIALAEIQLGIEKASKILSLKDEKKTEKILLLETELSESLEVILKLSLESSKKTTDNDQLSRIITQSTIEKRDLQRCINDLHKDLASFNFKITELEASEIVLNTKLTDSILSLKLTSESFLESELFLQSKDVELESLKLEKEGLKTKIVELYNELASQKLKVDIFRNASNESNKTSESKFLKSLKSSEDMKKSNDILSAKLHESEATIKKLNEESVSICNKEVNNLKNFSALKKNEQVLHTKLNEFRTRETNSIASSEVLKKSESSLLITCEKLKNTIEKSNEHQKTIKAQQESLKEELSKSKASHIDLDEKLIQSKAAYIALGTKYDANNKVINFFIFII